ncbi:MAG TPA: rod shape-determining protein MreC [Cytophagaceae bacterium]|jgi:rod shape-determining protein MreC|nr:rod shape-determining protein MreC [Cytophagaceae bacterium]
MESLFKFFYRYRALTLFLVLEIFCGWMVVHFNTYQGSAFFNSSNVFTGAVLQTTDNIKYYFKLKSINKDLAEENKELRRQLQESRQRNTLFEEKTPDTARIYQYSYITAKVINNSTNKLSNYFTLDKGTEDGVRPGMGVLSTSGGVAGRVKACSGHYSTVLSILNEKWPLSAKIKRGNVDGIVEWKGGDPTEAELTHVGKHHKVFEGDTVVTSGYSSIFPFGIIIGKIKSVVDDGEKYNIKVSLATDYTAMSYIYVVTNKMKAERDSLETEIKSIQE